MIMTITAKELKILFGSPLAWVILGILQIVLAGVFLSQIDAYLGLQAQLTLLVNPPGVTEMVVSPLFGTSALLLLVVSPVLAMRLIAEERRNHTLPLLLSAPVSLAAIVMGKFLGLWLFLCLIAALGGSMALSLYAGGSLDVGLLLVGLLGQMLLAACFAALGLYFSCLTAHPAVAAICGIGAGLGLWLLGFVSKGQDALQALSLLQHFEHINRGFLDSADVLYFLLFTGTFLLLAINRLDSERLCA